MSEKNVRQRVRKHCVSKGCKVIPIEQGDGWPDLLVVPATNRVFFVETKSGRPGHKLADNQQDCVDALRLRGHDVLVIGAYNSVIAHELDKLIYVNDEPMWRKSER